MDEVLTVSRNLRNRDLQSASVILDFKHKTVLNSTLEGNTIAKDWHRITDYYRNHYARVIDQLMTANGHTDEKTGHTD
jgi:hypothetical protein